MGKDDGIAPSEILVKFCALLDADSDLQVKMKAAKNPQEVSDIANALGLEISPVELRIWARELSASYFPWGGSGQEYRQNFFKGYL